ncbi:MAG: glycoside hydrolase family 13 protein [bacterium]
MAVNNDKTPDWAKNSIGYICFVDAFASSVPDPQGKKGIYTGLAYGESIEKLLWHEKDPTLHHNSGFYGGDLKGAAYAVDYLQELGIDMVYLTPIFKALSNHKYDTLDHLSIDSHFGDINDFKDMVNVFHSKGIKVILDGVFNHTSSEHEWYKKAKSGDAKYKAMYEVNQEGYIMVWNGIETLPVLNQENPDVIEYFYSGENSVVKYWLKQGADGWRLDVAERLGKKTLERIRTAIKEIGEDKLLIGEVVETYGKEWLNDGELDGVMNYVFRGTTANFLTGKIDGNNYMNELLKMYGEYPEEKLRASWNLISTHDTNRILYDVNNDESLFKIAVALQFTYPGSPVIYFGDELGTTKGLKEEENRMGLDWEVVTGYEKYSAGGPMDWGKVNRYNSFHEFYKHMIWLRKSFNALKDGDFIEVCALDNVIAFFRNNKDSCVLVIVNKGNDISVKLNIPEVVINRAKQLKCIYGGNGYLNPDKSVMDFYIGGKNVYIFAG